MLNQALSVFDFLKIKYPDNSHLGVLYFYPLGLSLFLTLCATYVAIKFNGNYFTSERFGDLFTLLAILPGFYIAALSAIAAINSLAIDKIINGKAAPFLIKNEPDRTETYEQPLKRRVFLTMLFAYLAAVSLLLSLFLTLIRFVYSLDVIKEKLTLTAVSGHCLSISIFFILSLITLFFINQILILTLIGINYLGYKGLVDD
ncbi:hypothetical protein NCZ17_06455 [Acinetobacter modestus]|uniref:hypothetical protein n=1 Tax=Acinetobacter modestus TaxID=1776740 RepID=UPI002030EAF3|nr:hypothetical protein [Acinetobacter modestus]MCM1959011.1 hypothetical protein [Acinetobacter modestus]